MTGADIGAGKSGRLIWIAGWALAALILIAGSGAAALHQDFSSEPDNAMRLVRVRDFLGGQGWFDPVQHRLNPPDGTAMHWARWIDAAIAAPIGLLTPIIGQAPAEIITAFVWPLGLLALFMMLVVEVSGRIGARDGLATEVKIAGAIVAALAFPAVEKFSPNSFDHHNIELILGLLAVLGLMKAAESPRWGVVAGLALGAAMATAAEGVPLVATGLLVGGLLWLVKPDAYARGLGWLGVGLAASSLTLFPALVSPSDWGRPVCDAMSTPFLGIGLAGGAVAMALGFALPTLLSSTLVRRLVSSAILGAVAAGALIVLFPQCMGGGYSALSADMERLWMTQISESRSLLVLAGDDPAMMLSLAGAASAGVFAAVFYLARRWREAEGWIVLGFLVSAWAVLAWQIRGATFATAFAIPFGAWAVAKARHAYRTRMSAIRLLAFVGVAATSAAAAWASTGEALQDTLTPKRVLTSYEGRLSNFQACLKPAAFEPLKAVPTGVMLNHFSLGVGVLASTSHSVFAAPYHRDAAGTMTMINALRSTPDAAREIVMKSPANYVLICPALPEGTFYAHNPATPGTIPEATLSGKLAKGDPPDWLEPVALSGTPLKLYRVRR